jgi:hypothetical protein
MPSARFEPPFPAIERPQNYTSVRTATGIGPLQVVVAIVAVVVIAAAVMVVVAAAAAVVVAAVAVPVIAVE